MTTLITGGAGFVGSHVAECLLEQGETVVVVDNFNNYYDPALKRANAARLQQYPAATLVEGDIRDGALMQQLFEQHGVKRVAHMAAMAGVRFSKEQAELYMAVNTMGTLNLLEASRKTGVENFVLASTSSVYGETERLPFTEDDAADKPLAPYPASKRAAEILAHSYHHLFDLSITALRFFNVYGPSGRPDMMPMRLMHAVVSGEPMTIFNQGDIHRDWTYIDDTVKGVLIALERPLGYEVINLGVGQPISLKDFVETVETLAGREVNKIHKPTPPTDPPITFCNNDKARHLLDFAPSTTVQEGLTRTWAWFCETFKPAL